ncbi:MAG: archaemetzincin [Desulfobacteraceae bacterium]
MEFKPPGPADRLRAIGSTQRIPGTLAKALDPGDDFEPLPWPNPSDWLAVHPEPGQTYEEFVSSNWNRPDAHRQTIYLQPLGEFPPGRSPDLASLKDYAAGYFALPVQVLSPFARADQSLRSRLNPISRNRQLYTGDILALARSRLPADAFCLLAITMTDLYPDPAWNFVFGQASLRERVGVYSFARYDPAFYGEPRGPDYQILLLRRSCKVLVHETSHMFGLQHCIFFKCVMNGSNHLQESDSRPLHLCPVCLRKLQYSIGFEVVDRYHRLLPLCQGLGFTDEAQWLKTRLARILKDQT